MNEIASLWLLYIFMNIFKVVIIYYYLKGFLGFKESVRPVWLLSTFGLFFVGFQYLSMERQGIHPEILLAYMVLILFIGSFLCKGSLLSKVLAIIIFVTLTFSIETVAGFAVSIFGDFSFTEISSSQLLSLATYFITNILAFVMVRFVSIVRRAKLTKLSFKFYFTVIALPLSSIILIYIIFQNAVVNPKSTFQNMQMIGLFGLILANISVFSLFEDRLAYAETEQKMALINQQLESQITSYQDLEEQQISTRKLRHDMRNYLNALSGYIRSSDAEMAMEYIGNLSDSIDQLESVSNTGIAAVDAIINTKYNAALKKDIRLEWRVSIPQELQIDSMDICLILGNALDNAIEACERNVRKENRVISLEMTLKDHYLVICVINPTEEKVKIIDGTVATTKDNKKYHGFGLENMRNIAEQYNGNMVIEFKDSLFYLNIILQN